jgi:hypothetical protein
MARFFWRSLTLSILVLILVPTMVFGQNIEALCRTFINEAYRDLGTNCANLNNDEVCYGLGSFGEITTTFYVDGQSQIVRDDIFGEPSERISLIDPDEISSVESITTEAFFLDQDNDSEDENRWGVANFTIQANLPRQLEQNNVVYILFGGGRIENGVLPEDSLILLEEPVELIVSTNTALFGSPIGLGYTVPSDQVGSISGSIQADGISPDGSWLRIFFLYERDFGERATAWVQVADIDDTTGIDTLPVIGPDTYTPMQKIFLTNSFNNPICDNVPPPGLLIQGPDEIETDVMVNNVPIRVTSTVLIEQLSAIRVRITSISGIVRLFSDTGNQDVLPPGYSRVLCLTPEESSLGIDELENDRGYDEECPEGEADILARGDFAGLPSNILNYRIPNLSLICPSGVGSPPCTIQLPPSAAARIERLCAIGVIPANVCTRFGF